MTLTAHYPAVDPDHTVSTLVAHHAGAERVDPPQGERYSSHAGPSGRSGWDLAARITQLVLLVTLAGSVVHTAIHLPGAPEVSADPTVRVRSDLVLMLLQCGGGLIVVLLPGVIQRRFRIAAPSTMRVGLFMFLFASIYLGEVRSFYYRFPIWDSILHFLSGAMLAALGLFLTQRHTNTDHQTAAINPGFAALFAFCFAAASGAVWETYEYVIDGLFDTNMQKVVTDTGEILTGSSALADTMSDIILGATAALIVAIASYLGHCAPLPPAALTPPGLAVRSDPWVSEADCHVGAAGVRPHVELSAAVVGRLTHQAEAEVPVRKRLGGVEPASVADDVEQHTVRVTFL